MAAGDVGTELRCTQMRKSEEGKFLWLLAAVMAGHNRREAMAWWHQIRNEATCSSFSPPHVNKPLSQWNDTQQLTSIIWVSPPHTPKAPTCRYCLQKSLQYWSSTNSDRSNSSLSVDEYLQKISSHKKVRVSRPGVLWSLCWLKKVQCWQAQEIGQSSMIIEIGAAATKG